VVGDTVLAVLHELELRDVALQDGCKIRVGTLSALHVETLLSVAQFADEPMMMREHLVIAPTPGAWRR